MDQENNSKISQYWIGKDLPLGDLWQAYQGGIDYLEKFNHIEAHFLEISFSESAEGTPFGSFEVVYKTIKSYFHQIKQTCFQNEYSDLAPLYFYSAFRHPTRYLFLGQINPLLIMAISLIEKKFIGDSFSDTKQILEFVRINFPEALVEDKLNQFQASRGNHIDKDYFEKLINLGLSGVKVTKKPFTKSSFIYEMIDLFDVENALLAESNLRVAEPQADYPFFDWEKHIAKDQEVCGGQPCIKGTRILVSVILDNVATGQTFDEILNDYPSLTRDDIKAALIYAAQALRSTSTLVL
jgi:uncharacterized protein (DUF433 family)